MAAFRDGHDGPGSYFQRQFEETQDERNDRLRQSRQRRTLDTLWSLIAALSDGLTDEGPNWSTNGLHNMRVRVANALPPDKCPDWLKSYRDPALVRS